MDNDELLIAIQGMFEKKTGEIKQYVNEKLGEQRVLIEDLHRDLKAVADGHSILNNKLDRTETKIDKIGGRLDSVELEVKSLKSELAVVKEYVINVDAKLNEHEAILKRVK